MWIHGLLVSFTLSPIQPFNFSTMRTTHLTRDAAWALLTRYNQADLLGWPLDDLLSRTIAAYQTFAP